MIDINYIRKNPTKVKKLIELRSDPSKANIDLWLKLDKDRSEIIKKLNQLQRTRNELSAEFQETKDKQIIEKVKDIKGIIKEEESKLADISVTWQQIIDWIPNISDKKMTEGEGEPDNIVLKAWTPKTKYLKEAEGLKARSNTEEFMPQFPTHAKDKNFTPLHHLDLGESKGFIDNKQAAKVSGSRFTYVLGDLALLQYALQRYIMDELIKRGFTYIIPPILVKERSLYGTSHFPEGKDQVYAIKNDNVEEKQQLYLLGSTEPANFSYGMDRIFEEGELPLKLMAYYPSFRSEAGSWGRDTKGIKRVHQFDKIEMDVICTPEQSKQIFDELLAINEWLLQSLELPYQLVQKCTGDAGYHASSYQVDPEVWLPVQKEFMEVMTDTNATDFQARRLNIKYEDKSGNKHYVHTVNDTGVAMGRMLIAIIENYQQADGRIKVPSVLTELIDKEYI